MNRVSSSKPLQYNCVQDDDVISSSFSTLVSVQSLSDRTGTWAPAQIGKAFASLEIESMKGKEGLNINTFPADSSTIAVNHA